MTTRTNPKAPFRTLPRQTEQAAHTRKRQRGTTLIELMVAMAILLIVSAVAFSLFNDISLANANLQAQEGLSMSLRSATAQLQMDLANAGNGYFQGDNVPSWPIGITIVNHFIPPGSTCIVGGFGGNYGPNCFDQLNVIAAEPNLYPAVNPTNSNGDSNPVLTSCPSPAAVGAAAPVSTTLYAMPAPVSDAFPSGLTAAQTEAKFSVNDQLLFVHNTLTGTLVSTALVTNVGLNSNGTAVALKILQTYSDGSNVMSNDPMDISSCDRSSFTSLYSTTSPTTTSCPVPGSASPFTPNYFLANGNNFCGTSDWIVKLRPISYQVCAGPGSPSTPYACDQSANSPDIADPKLYRTQNNVSSIVMDQILGFKVGASVLNTLDDSFGSTPYYNYNSSTYQVGTLLEGWNFSLVRSVRISMIARSDPATTTASMGSKTGTYRNPFDGGAYQVRGTVIIIDPRNLSMNDDNNLPTP